MIKKNRLSREHKSQSGFTLTEAMVGVAVFSILMLVTSQTLITTNSTQALIDIQAKQRHSFNIAEMKIRNILSHATYFFEVDTGVTPVRDILPQEIRNSVGTALKTEYALPPMPYDNHDVDPDPATECKYILGNTLYFASAKSKDFINFKEAYSGTISGTWSSTNSALFRNVEIHALYLKEHKNDSENSGLFDLMHYVNNGFYEDFSKLSNFENDFFWTDPTNYPLTTLSASTNALRGFLEGTAPNYPNFQKRNIPPDNVQYYPTITALRDQLDANGLGKTELVLSSVGSTPKEVNTSVAVQNSVAFYRHRQNILRVVLNSNIYSPKLKKTISAKHSFDIFPRSKIGAAGGGATLGTMLLSDPDCVQ